MGHVMCFPSTSFYLFGKKLGLVVTSNCHKFVKEKLSRVRIYLRLVSCFEIMEKGEKTGAICPVPCLKLKS